MVCYLVYLIKLPALCLLYCVVSLSLLKGVPDREEEEERLESTRDGVPSAAYGNIDLTAARRVDDNDNENRNYYAQVGHQYSD